jgi:hypothetical protein
MFRGRRRCFKATFTRWFILSALHGWWLPRLLEEAERTLLHQPVAADGR